MGEPGRVRKYGEGRCTRRTKLPRESYREEGGAKLPGAWRGGWLRARPPFRLQPRDREGAGASGSGSKAEEKPGAPGGEQLQLLRDLCRDLCQDREKTRASQRQSVEPQDGKVRKRLCCWWERWL